MSAYSKKDRVIIKSQSQNLPMINNMFCKDKKYKYRDQSKEKALRFDIDSYIHHLVNKENNPCEEKLRNHVKSISNKVELKHQRFINSLEFLQHSSPQTQQIKNIRTEIHKYITKMGKFAENQSGEYVQFVRLSQQSLDYLQYYLKNHFKEEKELNILHHIDNKIILSMLKNNYKCLTENPTEISHRIMLSFGINPLNDFHFIDWATFSKFRKLALGSQNKLEGRHFLVNYFMVNNKYISKGEFWAIIGGIIRKLQRVINQGNVQHLIERIQTYGNTIIGQGLTTKQLQHLIISQHFFIWQELLSLIFIT